FPAEVRYGYWTVQESHGTATHVLIWRAGNPTRLREIQAEICPHPENPILDLPSSYSNGINSAGHIVGTTMYPAADRGRTGCAASWLWDGAAFTPLPNPI